MSNNTVRLSRKFFAILAPITLLTIWLLILGIRSLGWGSNISLEQERTLEINQPTWPKGILELVEVKNLNSATFPKKFQLVVKNVSTKPIYYLQIIVVFPESKRFFEGRAGGFTLRYGNTRLNSAKSLAEPEDVPLNPGETCELGLDDDQPENFFKHLTPEVRSELMTSGIARLKLFAQHVNFGDGTGNLAGSPYPVKRLIGKTLEEGGGCAPPFCFTSDRTTQNGCLGSEYPCLHDTVWNSAPELPCKRQFWIPQSCGCDTLGFDDCTPLAE